MNWSQEAIEKIYIEVQNKSMVDKSFREKLLKDPITTISETFDVQFPDGFKIRVVENSPQYNATYVLPDLLSDELSDDDLDDVAGGIAFLIGISACAAAISVSACGANGCAANVSIK